MAWTAPRTWVATETVTAAQLNTHVRDNENALNSSVSGDNEPTVPHQHKSGIYANRTAASIAGRFYVATDLGPAVLMDTGTTWVFLAAPPRVTEHFFDDFISSYALNWQTSFNGSGAAADIGSNNSSNGRLSTGTTNGSAALFTPRTATAFTAVAASRTPAIFETKCYLLQTTQSQYYAGMLDTFAAPSLTYNTDPNNGVYFRRRAGASGVNIFSVTRASSVETATDLGVGNDANAHALRIEILSTTSIQFYVDDVLKATHTTNIPTVGLNIVLSVANNETVTKLLDADYVSWLAKRL